jgi:hypothetical protein
VDGGDGKKHHRDVIARERRSSVLFPSEDIARRNVTATETGPDSDQSNPELSVVGLFGRTLTAAAESSILHLLQ